MQLSKFTIHHCNIVFDWWFRTICCWFERFSFKDDIYLSWRYWHCNFAGNTAWINMSANRSLLLIVKSFFFFFFVLSVNFDILFLLSAFPPVWDIFKLTVLIFSSKNSISGTGVKQTSSSWLQKSDVVIKGLLCQTYA